MESKTIAVLTDAYVDYQKTIIDIASGIFADSGYRTLCFAGGSLEEPVRGERIPAAGNEIYKLVEQCDIAGIMAFTGGLGRHVDKGTLTRFLYRFDVPVISLGVCIEGIPSIIAEDQHGMKEMMRHVLADSRRQRLAFLRGVPTDLYSLEREAIFRACLAETNRIIDESLFITGNYNAYDAHNAVHELLRLRPDVDTIIAASDLMALSAARAVSSLGLMIPHDVAITGFDDAREATEHSPALTTVRKPMVETAVTGARQLLDLIGASISGTTTSEVAMVTQFPSTLVVRGSTSQPESTSIVRQPKELKSRFVNSIDRLEKPPGVDIEELADTWLQTLQAGSYSRLCPSIDALKKVSSNHSKIHWVHDLCCQIELLSQETLAALGRPDDICVIRGILEPLREATWSRVLVREFDGHRVGQARSSLQVQIGSCIRLTDTLNVLDEWLATVRPHRFYLVQYDHPSTSIPATARLIRSAVQGKVQAYKPTTFETASLLPIIVYEETMQSQLIFYPVFAADQHYGYILIEATDLEQRYIYDVSLSIGNAMRGQLLIQSLESQTFALKRSNHDLLRLANYDVLTGLPNRQYFERYVDKACKRSAAAPSRFAVGFLDLDGFKMVNDTLGHESGDQLLRQIATRLTASLKQQVGSRGLLARLAGDEFTLIVKKVSDQEMERVCITLLESLRQPCLLGDHEVSVSASFGYAYFPDDATATSTLLRCADTAMYDAKFCGKNCAVRASISPIRKRTNTLTLAQSLRTAIENHELVLHYQPRIDLKTSTICGVEALTRWFVNTPDGPQLKSDPAEFIPIAEKSGLVTQLDTHALFEACRQARVWADSGTPLSVSVNVSVMQLQQNGFVELVFDALNSHGISADLLELEITESAMMGNIEENICKLKLLRNHGVQVSIDDFGTGYSSLSYLKRLPVGCLKVDGSFIKDIHSEDGGDSVDAALMRAIVTVAKSFQCSVVAEGIETEQHRRFAVASGFDEGQGFYFDSPQPAHAITARLQNHSDRRPACVRTEH